MPCIQFDQKSPACWPRRWANGIEITQLLLNTTEYKQLGRRCRRCLRSPVQVKFDVVDASQFNLFRRAPYRGGFF